MSRSTKPKGKIMPEPTEPPAYENVITLDCPHCQTTLGIRLGASADVTLTVIAVEERSAPLG